MNKGQPAFELHEICGALRHTIGKNASDSTGVKVAFSITTLAARSKFPSCPWRGSRFVVPNMMPRVFTTHFMPWFDRRIGRLNPSLKPSPTARPHFKLSRPETALRTCPSKKLRPLSDCRARPNAAYAPHSRKKTLIPRLTTIHSRDRRRSVPPLKRRQPLSKTRKKPTGGRR